MTVYLCNDKNNSWENIFPVGTHIIGFVNGGKIRKMCRSVNFMVKLFGICQLQVVLHGRVVTHACKNENNKSNKCHKKLGGWVEWKICQKVGKIHTQYYGSAFVLGISCIVFNMCVIENELKTVRASGAQKILLS